MNIYLLWESAIPPDGWELDTSHDDRLLRGGATYDDGIGHTHGISGASGGSQGDYIGKSGLGGMPYSGNQHTHSISNTSQADELPPYRSIRLIKSTMLFGTLPTNIISFAKTVLSGWTEQTDFNSKFIYLKNQTPANGGASTHTHNPPAITGEGGSNKAIYGHYNITRVKKNHTHDISGTIDAATTEPNWYGMRVCKLGADQTTPKGLIAMFDEVPPLVSGWKVISISERYIKQAAYGTLGGDPTHTHAHNLSTDSGNTGYYPACVSGCNKYYTVGRGHTHSISLSDSEYEPPYAQFIFCEFVGAEALLQPIYGTKTYSILRPDDDLQIGDTVRVYQTSSGPVAVKESWVVGEKITLQL